MHLQRSTAPSITLQTWIKFHKDVIIQDMLLHRCLSCIRALRCGNIMYHKLYYVGVYDLRISPRVLASHLDYVLCSVSLLLFFASINPYTQD